ncbi:MAG TPA: ADP-forming succinate--CoA ligase subunit beta [Candidatus Azoamicus sp. OHIO1]
MYLHEYQSKELFKSNGIPVPRSFLIRNISDIEFVCNLFRDLEVYCKVQVHSGARKKNGGVVRLLNNYDSLFNFVNKNLGKKFFTEQIDKYGKIVNSILVEEVVSIYREFYLSVFVDRTLESIVLMISSFGGTDVESCKDFIKIEVDIFLGFKDYQIRNILSYLDLNRDFFLEFKFILTKFFNFFLKNDVSLLEINPLVVTDYNKLLCLDAKVEIDDNSLYRHLDLKGIFDFSQRNSIEFEAEKYGLSYVSLDGNIGCIVNGAGLAMATMDLLFRCGGKPANFLDIGGNATKDRVFEAFKLLLLNKNLKSIFVNVFGGIVRCDLIANSIIDTVNELYVSIPIVIRFVGNNSEYGIYIIKNSNLNMYIESDFLLSVEKVIKFSEEIL